ncbi:S66 peptidase family protein [Kineococcus sp. SYSU DK003]|uniref:S66 peptidase family protein n=1 Tax=Kineococcus sp. SYSU DK003 TaxID=3383124 RepID=UPI003D7C923C
MVSPSSWPDSGDDLDPLLETLTAWGLRPEVGAHVADRRGYMAGSDADRLADLNQALRDPGIRAVIASRGGCGSLRLLPGIDREALQRDPTPLIGYSDLTALHQLWRRSGVPAVHGAVDGAHADAVRAQLMDAAGATVPTDPAAVTAGLTTTGTARGVLVGGNLEMLARCTGVVDVSWRGCLLLVEANKAAGLGMVDRALTQLRLSGALAGLTGVAVGSFEEFTGYQDRGWAVTDVLHDLLDDLGVPILGGLPLGHLPDPVPVPLGVPTVLDADAGRLTVDAAVR